MVENKDVEKIVKAIEDLQLDLQNTQTYISDKLDEITSILKKIKINTDNIS